MSDLRTTKVNGQEIKYLDKNQNGKCDKGESLKEMIIPLVSAELEKPENKAKIDSLVKESMPTIFDKPIKENK